ncbi:MAG: oligosaccharide flippase family protein, partial [Myxococcales bacterium]|nr:oligosaccharide flippase family protein [Myxococcales bacterium]
MSGSRVAKNSLILLIAEAARRGLSVVIAVLVARAMTVDDFGRFGLALALSGIFEVVGNFGLTSL